MLPKKHSEDSEKDANGNTLLHLASCKGHINSVISLLNRKKNIFAINNEGWTALGYAAANGHLEIVQKLVEFNPACLNFLDGEQTSPLQRAAQYGRAEIVAFLLGKRANLKSQDEQGRTPLHTAVSRYFDNEQVIRLLVRNGADLKATTNTDWTPLHSAARYGSVQNASVLISLKANIEARNNYGETPLNMIASHERMDAAEKIAMVRFLLSKGAQVDTQDESGKTPLHWAIITGNYHLTALLLQSEASMTIRTKKGETALFFAMHSKHKEITSLVIAAELKQQGQGATIASIIDRAGSNGNTMLHVACCDGHMHVVEQLLRYKPNIFFNNEEGWTALGFAAANGHLEIVQRLVEFNPACLNFLDGEQTSPLQRAAQYGRAEIVAFLLGKRADLKSQDQQGRTPLHTAVSRYFDNEEVIRLLVSSGADLEATTDTDWTLLHSAARYGSVQNASVLISLKANIEARNNYGETPLNMIASHERMDAAEKIAMVRFLLSKGAQVNTQDETGKTPLHWAIITGNIQLTALLLQSRASTTISTKKGETALFFAMHGKHKEITSLIMAAELKQQGPGANIASIIDRTGSNGNTMLHIACCDGYMHVVEQLLRYKPNVLLHNEEGWTALGYAAANGHLEIVQRLVEFNPACLNFLDGETRSALQRAANYGRTKIVQYFLSKSVSIESADEKGKTVLHSAVSRYCCNEETIRFLINAGANLEAATGLGWTPLHSAARYSTPETIKLLVRLGAKLEAVNDAGETPLNMVMAEEKMTIEEKITAVAALLQCGANVNAPDNTGETPLQRAYILGDKGLLKLLTRFASNNAADIAPLLPQQRTNSTPVNFHIQGRASLSPARSPDALFPISDREHKSPPALKPKTNTTSSSMTSTSS